MIIQTRNLSKRFDQFFPFGKLASLSSALFGNKNLNSMIALSNLNISVPTGSAYGLIGANGAGKTTLIKTLLNFLQPSSGVAEILDKDSRNISTMEFARIGYISENQELPNRLTVDEYFDYLRPFYDSWDKSLESSIRRQFELPGNRKIGHLSHGMRIKMALCCALPYRPILMILDEPFSGLDSLVRDDFMSGLLERASDMTILISSHEHVEFEKMLSHVGYLQKGKLLFEETMDQVTERFRSVSVILSQTSLVANSFPSHWINAKKTGNSLSFVETQYSSNSFDASIKSHLQGVVRIDTQPMPLRSIFTELEIAARDHDISPSGKTVN